MLASSLSLEGEKELIDSGFHFFISVLSETRHVRVRHSELLSPMTTRPLITQDLVARVTPQAGMHSIINLKYRWV